MPTGFKLNYKGAQVDLDDVYVRKHFFGPSTGWLWSFGSGGSGILGDNTVVAKSSPVQTIAGGSNWSYVAAGPSVATAIKTDGTLWLWGRQTSGALGDNSVVTRSSPVQTVSGGNTWKQSSSGTNYAAAIKTDGTLWLWGGQTSGSLGDNTAVSKSSPVQTVAGGTNWSQVSVGGFSAAIKTDGTLWCWGTGTSGQLGDNTIVSKSSPVQTVDMGTNWLQVAAGSANIAAIKTDGTLWVWGNNSGGSLGDNTIVSKSSPVQTIAGGTNWKQVSVSNIGQGTFAGVKTDGTLWLWGANSFGQLGDNSISSRSSPVQTIAGGTNWKQVSAGVLQTIATKTDGTLWAWGSNSPGNLGNNTTISRSSPVQVIGNAIDWLSVSSGGSGYNLAIKSS